MDDAAIKGWFCHQHHGSREGGFIFTDQVIEVALMLKSVFVLSLRATEGFINSLFKLMDILLISPDYSCLSKRAKTVKIAYRAPSHSPIAHVVIDATGLKIFGEGEWEIRKHVKEKRRVWRKLHLAVDALTHAIIAAEVSLESVIEQVSADGAYDTRACHKLLNNKGIKAVIPPRSNAGYWSKGHIRNEAVDALKAGILSD
ncbi:Transposase DDE domain protein [Shewanella khirikhana]|uniref:Transposase DDE domain protein n=1 Tax=Shewanella khirikhana TaxID=1965282 RepID=A0ABN5TYT1_9GAMM|nr:Transposase DDE domain protein [Shewanella khirikhana]